MELLVLVIGLIALDLLAVRFGRDSRDGFGTEDHGRGASLMGWSDSAYEQDLAHEIQAARERRLVKSQVAETPLQQAHDDLARAAQAQATPREERSTWSLSSTRRPA